MRAALSAHSSVDNQLRSSSSCGTPEVQDRLGEVLGSPERLREVLRILAEVGAGEEWTLEGILGRARGLTVPEVLEREDGPAILGALADHVFAQLEGGDHADTPDPT